jgi:hypothetical protein
MVVDGAGNIIASTSNNLNVQCANCSGSGVSTTDEATFTAGTSIFAGSGGFFQTTPTSNALTNGQQGMLQMTANRAAFTNLRNAAGTEIGTAAAPFQVSVANTAANGTAMLVTGTGGTFPISGSLTANQSVNVAQVNGVTTLAGAGASGTGAQRVTISQDVTTVAGSASIPAGTNLVGKVGVDQTTPGTTNNVAISALPRGARNFPGCTVAVTTGQCLAANTAVQYLSIQNTSVSANIACSFGVSAVLNSSTSIQLAPGQPASWGPQTAGVPSGAMNCIASAATTPLYVEWN